MKVFIKSKIFSTEAILSAYMHTHTHTHTYTYRHLHTGIPTIQNLIYTQLKMARKQRLETNEDSSTEQKTWQVYSFDRVCNLATQPQRKTTMLTWLPPPSVGLTDCHLRQHAISIIMTDKTVILMARVIQPQRRKTSWLPSPPSWLPSPSSWLPSQSPWLPSQSPWLPSPSCWLTKQSPWRLGWKAGDSPLAWEPPAWCQCVPWAPGPQDPAPGTVTTTACNKQTLSPTVHWQPPSLRILRCVVTVAQVDLN